jgi:hypothetical protein
VESCTSRRTKGRRKANSKTRRALDVPMALKLPALAVDFTNLIGGVNHRVDWFIAQRWHPRIASYIGPKPVQSGA